jgi:hypothetical protein
LAKKVIHALALAHLAPVIAIALFVEVRLQVLLAHPMMYAVNLPLEKPQAPSMPFTNNNLIFVLLVSVLGNGTGAKVAHQLSPCFSASALATATAGFMNALWVTSKTAR